jgi:hypothetical protein
VVQDDAGDDARGHRDQNVVGPDLYPLLTARRRREAVLAMVDHHILVGAQIAWKDTPANKLGPARAVVVMALFIGALLAPVSAAIVAPLVVVVPVVTAIVAAGASALIAAIVAALAVVGPMVTSIIAAVASAFIAPVVASAIVSVVMPTLRLLLNDDAFAPFVIVLRKRRQGAQTERGGDNGGNEYFERHGNTPMIERTLILRGVCVWCVNNQGFKSKDA